MRKLILFAIILAVANACVFDTTKKEEDSGSKKSKKEGVAVSKYPNGKIRSEITMKNGKKNGRATDYYESGVKHLEIDYVNNIKHGWARRYYENGKLYQETPYDSGEMHGIQKKYRENGKLSAEIPYRHNLPCMGLKEYVLDGSPKTNYPTIVVTPVDNLWRDGEYILKLSLSDKSRAVEFFEGDLDEGGCLGFNAVPVGKTDPTGVAIISYRLPPGGFVMETINIIAKVQTLQGNYYITQRKYNLAIENKP